MAIGLNSQIKNQKLNGKQLNRFMKIHFIGIGGIGVSALAKYFLEKGNEISGSDLESSEITESLKKGGAKIKIGKHKISNFHTRLRGTCSYLIFDFYQPVLKVDF